MWCAACRADVAAELSADNRRMLCARCQSELGTAAGAMDRPTTGVRLQDTERNARELLARWSTQHRLESPLATTTDARPVEPVAAVGKPANRYDAAHSVPAPSAPTMAAAQGRSDERPVERRRRKKRSQPQPPAITAEATSARPPAHDDLVRLAVQQPEPPPGNWTTMVGQLCAYAGVAVLTLGTVMVLSGYFGGPTNYAPTGWLVAAVGQMLLFLGVVTLVSGGMEQTVDEVSWRIDQLADQIFRLEQMIVNQQAQQEESQRRNRRRMRSSRDQADAA
ncbi:MAG: hypothetical protein JSS49_22665 [Planctomycetes bacterium]|nr:hypothetical protein [Planctomycetota bacterium]